VSRIVFENNATSTLAGSITNVATTASLSAGTGALFPNPVTADGDYFVLTFTDQATGILNEIVHVTARSGDVITMTRAQEGTTALAWTAGDLATMLITAGTAEAFLQDADLSTGAGVFLVDAGTANAIEITAPADIADFYADMIGSPIRIEVAATNTGATTIDVTGAGTTPLVNADGSELVAGQIQAGSIITAIYSDNAGNFYLQTITTAPPPTRGRHVINAGSSTYAVPNNALWWTVYATGGGGGGAGGDGTYAGGNGGAGGTAIQVMSFAVSATRTITYAIGAAGTGGAASGGSETAGGNTTVTCGSYSLTATGGSPGVHAAAPAGGQGGIPTGSGAQLLYGGAGGDGGGNGGQGGASYWGGGGRASTVTSAAVQNGAAPGSGGGGGYGGSSVTGGAGAAGCLVIEWGA